MESRSSSFLSKRATGNGRIVESGGPALVTAYDVVQQRQEIFIIIFEAAGLGCGNRFGQRKEVPNARLHSPQDIFRCSLASEVWAKHFRYTFPVRGVNEHEVFWTETIDIQPRNHKEG
ncbi:Fez family zinc finger protein 1 [Striga asiatica]|uniref:Fez family zinc finger protein 1 n=1 Tax=Striga asiatica TaxID=4170 RepID=A0A5A7P9N8_STRAF|nr:Fez family zinc finger protein 1 [Striga asiatica]